MKREPYNKEFENIIHCWKCGYKPSGYIYVEKCPLCNVNIYFPSSNKKSQEKGENK